MNYQRLLLEEVADTEGETLPAETGSGYESEAGLPVQGELERNLLEAVFETKLGTDTGPKNGLRIFAIVIVAETYIGLRASVEIEGTYRANLEVVGSTEVSGTCAPTEIKFSETVGTEGVLIGKFCTITGANTDSTGLCVSNYCQA